MPDTPERVAAAVATSLVYLFLLALFLAGRASETPLEQRRPPLYVFAFPKPVPTVTPLPPQRRPVATHAQRNPRRHMSATVANTAPADTAVAGPPLHERLALASPLSDAPPIASGLGAGTAVNGLGGGTGGSGTGGAGGDGSVAGVRYGRAAWIVQPTNEEMMPFWPDRARREKVRGQVVLSCELLRPGHPRHCSVLDERPAGYGFGGAAVSMSHMFQVRPVTRNGKRAEMPVIIPILFNYRDLPPKH